MLDFFDLVLKFFLLFCDFFPLDVFDFLDLDVTGLLIRMLGAFFTKVLFGDILGDFVEIVGTTAVVTVDTDDATLTWLGACETEGAVVPITDDTRLTWLGAGEAVGAAVSIIANTSVINTMKMMKKLNVIVDKFIFRKNRRHFRNSMIRM